MFFCHFFVKEQYCDKVMCLDASKLITCVIIFHHGRSFVIYVNNIITVYGLVMEECKYNHENESSYLT